jgi:predicted acylesterase/phospholipase RssA/CRP-like cAMP-binding protein
MRALSPLFNGLDADALDDVYAQMLPRQFAAGETICREGDASDSLFIIQRGLAEVSLQGPDGPHTIARLRRGEVLGELSLVIDEPRTATVTASIPSEALELSREAFAALLSRYPALLANLNTILGQRLAARRSIPGQRRGEAVALVSRGNSDFVDELLESARSAATDPVEVVALERQPAESAVPPDEARVESILSALDERLSSHRLVIVAADVRDPELPCLLAQMDRVLVVLDSESAQPSLERFTPFADRTQIALIDEKNAGRSSEMAGIPVVRSIRKKERSLDVAWLGRHLARTKLGLALGAGGAKGYAHVGALYVLEEAGYTVDYVSGSSIGALVGAWLGLGMSAREIEDTMRQSFTPQNVADMFKLSMSGMATGLEVHTRICRERTSEKSFSDLQIPLIAMAIDLNTRHPAPIMDGPLWEALLASTALAGMFPPFQRDNQRLVDGIALVPVPSDAVRDAGADVVVSVNLIGRDVLPTWPGQPVPEEKPKRFGSRMLDALLEVMDISQTEASVRHAGRADVTITPVFGPGTWRDFDLADLYLAAGKSAAKSRLPELQRLARPQFHGITTSRMKA